MLAINQETYDELLDYFLSGLRDSILNWFNDKDLPEKEQLSILESILNDIGNLWKKGEITLIITYIASRVTEEISLGWTKQERDRESIAKARIVLGTIEEDNHSLGKNMIKRFLEPFFEVHDLGIDVKSEFFIQKAKEIEADIIAVSALMMTSVIRLENLKKSIEKNKWSKKPKLLVGGAPFTLYPRLYKKIGADGYAANAFVVVEKCIELLQEK